MTTSHERVTPRRLKGFQDYAPATMARRLEIMATLREQARLAGFQEIGTPALEYADVLLGVGGETDKQVFLFEDGGDRKVGMRYDLTVPFARYMAENHGKIPLPFNRVQMGDVWRAEKPQRGRFREFMQGDLDIIGVDSLQADAEVIHTLYETLSRVMFIPFRMTLNHRQILSALIRALGVEPANETHVLITLDKLHKVGRDAVVKILLDNAFMASAANAETLVDILLRNDFKAVEERLQNEDDKVAWTRFLKTVELLKDLTQPQLSPIEIDLSVVRGLAYYTGIVFETTIPQMTEYGSICSGGRYNQLTARFTHHEIAGVGGSIGVDRLTALLDEFEGPSTDDLKPQVYIAVAEEGTFPYAFQLAKRLRTAGIKVDLPLREQKLGAQFKHANRIGVAYVLTVGGAEMESRTVNLKTMQTGEERSVEASQLLEALKF